MVGKLIGEISVGESNVSQLNTIGMTVFALPTEYSKVSRAHT